MDSLNSFISYHFLRSHIVPSVLTSTNFVKSKSHMYWAIQAGLLTPLTFAWHRLNPLAAFTSGVYFLHNGRRWQWIREFYTANFKCIFGGS